MNRIFAIGDIHGCNATFQKMLFEEIKIQKQDDLYCIGDYIDRGPDSKGVIDTLLKLREEGYHIHTIRGNHEQMMMDSGESREHLKLWIKNGGDKTLKSFKAKSFEKFPEEYKQFFCNTKHYLINGNYIFVHAGLNFEQKNIFEDKETMLWIRDFETYQPKLENKILIHGHTPQPLTFIKNQKGNCINIDGGCVFKEYENLGNLIAISLPQKEIKVVPYCH